MTSRSKYKRTEVGLAQLTGPEWRWRYDHDLSRTRCARGLFGSKAGEATRLHMTALALRYYQTCIDANRDNRPNFHPGRCGSILSFIGVATCDLSSDHLRRKCCTVAFSNDYKRSRRRNGRMCWVQHTRTRGGTTTRSSGIVHCP